MVGDKARNLVSPHLNGIVGGEIAQVEGFRYSKATDRLWRTKRAFGLKNCLMHICSAPAKQSGTRMSLLVLRKPQDRANADCLSQTIFGSIKTA